jgi:hypothetical protein
MYKLPSSPTPPAIKFGSSVEDMLLVNCAVLGVDPEKIRKILTPDMNWNYILENANDNRITTLLYYNLQKFDNDLVPVEVMEQFQKTYKAILARNIIAFNELKQILKSFSEAQIETILLKGVALAETVYPDIALRPFGDIDLLIHKNDLYKLKPKLLQFGYELLESPDKAIKFIKKDGISLDIHWHLVYSPYSKYIDIDEFWKNTLTINMEGINAFVLSPENLLIHLCLHASIHNYPQLLCLVDISEVIRHYGETLNWELFLEKALRYKICTPMYYSLAHTKELFDTSIPDFVLDSLSLYNASSFDDKIFDALLAIPGYINTKSTLVDFLDTNGIIPKIRYLFRKLFPGKDYRAEKYPGKGTINSYFSHIGDILWRGIRLLLKISKYRNKRFIEKYTS